MSTARESFIVAEILRVIGARSDVRIWRNTTGTAVAPKPPHQRIKFGLVGSADILGIWRCLRPEPLGIFLAIEVKSANGVQRAPQAKFEAMVKKMGGVYILARSVEDVEAVIGK